MREGVVYCGREWCIVGGRSGALWEGGVVHCGREEWCIVGGGSGALWEGGVVHCGREEWCIVGGRSGAGSLHESLHRLKYKQLWTKSAA